VIADHSDGAGRNRSIGEACAVGLAACEREEEIAGLDRAAVERDTAHVERCDSGLDRGIIAQKILA
jgi:hypothetical protein